ncbi:histidine phosphatase family protein [Flavobacteriaceae bacterium F89]|uniref:Histidine phosphatase family protein n=1 Tax=Cerina litoralis TaxID=2874477 RepID=A0AAE3JQH5_9FLAO|nr:histidine phosphatase family protein [Cerina litoralis]MCG2461879.1 histidine phosphatase family protein [Cerina litoralis]
MKTLILMRHGKSSWDYEVNDRDRPLQERGINDALLVASRFVFERGSIDAVFSSPAIRALHTCTIFLRHLGFPIERLKLSEELYDFSGGNVHQFIKRLDDSMETVMIFGHNNAFTYIANSLGNNSIDNVPTAGLVQISFSINNWSAITQGTTENILFPKHLK